MCVSLVVLTIHGASAERRSDKVERWGLVRNVSEGEFGLRSRLAYPEAYSLHRLANDFFHRSRSADVQRYASITVWNLWNRAFATVLPLSFV